MLPRQALRTTGVRPSQNDSLVDTGGSVSSYLQIPGMSGFADSDKRLCFLGQMALIIPPLQGQRRVPTGYIALQPVQRSFTSVKLISLLLTLQIAEETSAVCLVFEALPNSFLEFQANQRYTS